MRVLRDYALQIQPAFSAGYNEVLYSRLAGTRNSLASRPLFCRLRSRPLRQRKPLRINTAVGPIRQRPLKQPRLGADCVLRSLSEYQHNPQRDENTDEDTLIIPALRSR